MYNNDNKWRRRLAVASRLSPRTPGKQSSSSNACPWLFNGGMRSPSKILWSPNEMSLQPFTLFSSNISACGFVLVAPKKNNCYCHVIVCILWFGYEAPSSSSSLLSSCNHLYPVMQVWSCEVRREDSRYQASPNNTKHVTWHGLLAVGCCCCWCWW